MPNNKGVQKGNYKIPNKSMGEVKAPRNIIKDGNSPQKRTGGDLRATRSGRK